MEQNIEVTTSAPPSPIFTLDLGSNGGLFSPKTSRELLEFINKERNFWTWITQSSSGNFRNAIDNVLMNLHSASVSAEEALRFERSDAIAFNQRIEQVKNFINTAYNLEKIPHSSTKLAKRVEELRQTDPSAAQAYLYVFLPSRGHHFDGRDTSSWRGFIEGICDRYDFSTVPKKSYGAVTKSLSELQEKTEHSFAEKTLLIEELHRQYQDLTEKISLAMNQQKDEFISLINTTQKNHEDALLEHKESMKTLGEVFKEKMQLRAPVEYWKNRETHHKRRMTVLGRWTFGSMAVLAVILAIFGYWTFSQVDGDVKPDAWRLAISILISVMGIWAVRLLVRMFLSHSHLMTDAAERITMVQTYLSLMEGDSLPSDEERKLILQPLFRPVSDGIIKDEGLPHPLIETLTRLGNR